MGEAGGVEGWAEYGYFVISAAVIVGSCGGGGMAKGFQAFVGLLAVV